MAEQACDLSDNNALMCSMRPAVAHLQTSQPGPSSTTVWQQVHLNSPIVQPRSRGLLQAIPVGCIFPKTSISRLPNKARTPQSLHAHHIQQPVKLHTQGHRACTPCDGPCCAAGLRIARGAAPITRTWILYNKPRVPQYTHAGVLMGLGLAGVLQTSSLMTGPHLSMTHGAWPRRCAAKV